MSLRNQMIVFNTRLQSRTKVHIEARPLEKHKMGSEYLEVRRGKNYLRVLEVVENFFFF